MNWQVESDPYEDGTPYFRFKSGDCFDDDTRTGFNFSAIMSESDARLVAAAPTMLAALVYAEAVLSIVEPRSDKAEYLRCLEQVRSALAKAKGSQP